jgi:hypothetical protein
MFYYTGKLNQKLVFIESLLEFLERLEKTKGTLLLLLW